MTEAPRRERERQRHRQEVLEAAEAVFAEKGYHNATMQEIAERAEFAVGTLYTMFEGKRVIYYELLHIRARQYLDRVRAAIERLSDPVEQVRAIIAAKFRFFEDNRRFFRIFTRATSGQQDELPFGMSEDGRAIYGQYLEMVRDVFAEGVRRGVFADLGPVLMALAMEGITHAVLAHGMHTGGEGLKEATPQNVGRLLFHGILARRDG